MTLHHVRVMTVIMWLWGSSSYKDNDCSIVLRAADGNERDVLLSVVENRWQLHFLLNVSPWLITIEFYIRWPTRSLSTQISLLVVVFPPTSKRISGQQFADFFINGKGKSVQTFLVYQGPSTKSNNSVLRLIVDPTLFTSSDIILSRILPPRNKDIDNQQFVDFDLVDHDRTWWGYIHHHEDWWSDVRWNAGVTLIPHSAVIPALEPTSCAATTLFDSSDIISFLIHRCSPAPI